MLIQLERMGAGVREISLPDLKAGRLAHTVTILGEMAQALSHTYKAHRREHGLDVRINLAMARALTAGDYVQAQRVRTRMIANFSRALEKADVIVTLCPMCQLNLDAYQSQVNRHFKTDYHIPVLYFTQMIGLALGISPDALGIGSEFVSAGEALATLPPIVPTLRI